MNKRKSGPECKKTGKCINCIYLSDGLYRVNLRKCYAIAEGDVPVDSINKELPCRYFSDKANCKNPEEVMQKIKERVEAYHEESKKQQKAPKTTRELIAV